jgi:hypothetical protein
MKFMRHTAGYSLLDHRRNDNILGELKQIQYISNQYNINKNGEIVLAGWKTLDTQNNSLTIDLSKDEDLDDR